MKGWDTQALEPEIVLNPLDLTHSFVELWTKDLGHDEPLSLISCGTGKKDLWPCEFFFNTPLFVNAQHIFSLRRIKIIYTQEAVMMMDTETSEPGEDHYLSPFDLSYHFQQYHRHKSPPTMHKTTICLYNSLINPTDVKIR